MTAGLVAVAHAAATAAGKAKTGEALKAGPGWFAVVLVLGVVCYFLFKSMSKHMRIVRDQFPVQPGPAGRRAPEQQPPTPAASTEASLRPDPAAPALPPAVPPVDA